MGGAFLALIVVGAVLWTTGNLHFVRIEEEDHAE
jgi:hypothetical protein